jgi:hypothetical protein
MPFTGISAKLAVLQKQILFLNGEITNLRKLLAMERSKNQELRKRNEFLQQSQKTMDNESMKEMPELLGMLLEAHEINSTRDPHGFRYPPELHDFFVLLSSAGPHVLGILGKSCGFPCYKTILRNRTSILHDINLNPETFNGDLDNLKKIIHTFLPLEFKGRVIIAVDAAYVTPKVAVNADGKVSGLIGNVSVDPEIARAMIEDDVLFHGFLQENRENIVKAEFVLIAAPLDPNYTAFPICALQSKSGSASIEIIQQISTIIAMLKDSTIDIFGISSDGDKAFHHFGDDLVSHWMADLPDFFDLTVIDFVLSYDSLYHLSNPLHLAKRDRYRKVSGKGMSASPLDNDLLFSVTILMELGFQEYLLDNSQARKMEDNLAIKFFCFESLAKIPVDLDFIRFSFLPTTLLLESVLNQGLTNKERVENLIHGISLVTIYLLVFDWAIQNSFLAQTQRSSNREFVTLWSCDWMEEYLSEALSLVFLIMTEDSLHLGACGTHFVEHLFGNLRRVSHGDDSDVQFRKKLVDLVMERILSEKLGLSQPKPYRRSDSGVILSVIEPIEIPSIGTFMNHAFSFMRSFIQIPDDIITFLLPCLAENFESEVPISGSDYLEKIKFGISPLSRVASTVKKNFTSVGGLCCIKKWVAAQQLKMILENNE